MAQPLQQVQPGDIITAAMWNLAVAAINELLAAGQTVGIEIAALLPGGTANDPIRLGTLLQITGQNFGHAIGQTTVTFRAASGDVVVERDEMLTGSSDTRLVLIVPPIPGLPQSGASMTLAVSNGVAEDTRTVFVQPVVIDLQGDVFVNWQAGTAVNPNPNPNPLQPGQPATFLYEVQTGTNLPADFVLNVDIPSASVAVPPNLVASIEVLTPEGQAIPNRRIAMGKSETRVIAVRIPSLPSSFATQAFTLLVGATSGNVSGNDTRSFTVGVPVTPSDPAIELQQTGNSVIDVATGDIDIDPASGRLEGSTIMLRPAKQMIVQLNAQLREVGTYAITIEPRAGGTLTGWTVGLVGTPATIVKDDTSLQDLLQFGVTAAAGATPGHIVFRVRRQGATGDQTREYALALLPG